MVENETLIRYISVWNWQILAIMFLIGSMIMLSLQINTKTQVFSIAFLISFFICEFIMFKRKVGLYNV